MKGNMERSPQNVNKRQLFIRNLSFQVDEETLTKLFEGIGPLKNVSVPKKPDGTSTGFGFVKFALEEDCATALEKFQGYLLDGREISLDYFTKRVVEGKEKTKPVSSNTEVSNEKEVTGDELPENNTEDKADGSHIRHSRQILVYGVPIDVNKKIFKSVLAKHAKNVIVELIKQDSEFAEFAQVIYPVGKVFLLTAPSRPDAQRLATTINATNLNNLGFGKFQTTPSKGADSDNSDVEDSLQQGLKLENQMKEKLYCRLVSDITPMTLRKKKCRIIIRNLSFQANERNILDKLKKFGPITEIDLPRTTVEKTKGGEKLTKERSKGFSFVSFLCSADAEAAINNSGGIKICNREVAMDLCLSKSAFEKYGKLDQKPEEDCKSLSSNSSSGSNDESRDVEIQDEVPNTDMLKGERKPTSEVSDVSEGRTVFVHGISFDTTPEDLQSSFSVYGMVELAIIVKDKVTGLSKGSAFVKFRNKDSVEILLSELSKKDLANKNTLEINNRKCFVNIAVSKSDLSVLKSSKQLGKDKRNLYLANEGINIIGQSETIMLKQDKEKRAKAQAEKKKKLQNPIFFISNKRLSIRNLSKKVTNHELKIICLKAVKRGLIDKGLVSTEDLKNQIVAEGLSAIQSNETSSSQLVDFSKLTLPAYDSKKCVISAKIMFDENKIRDGKPQSRGYAFVEFTNHIFALAALRELNNNPDYDSLSAIQDATDTNEKGRLMVEFTVENLRKVKILNNRKVQAKERAANQAMEVALEDLNEGEEEEVRKSKKKRKSDESIVEKKKKQKIQK